MRSVRTQRLRSSLARRQGFSVVELMIAILVVGVMSAAAMPAFAAAAMERRTNRAALDIVRLFRHAQTEAMAYGRAYAIFPYSPSGDNRDMKYSLWRGNSSRCGRNAWSGFVTPATCAGTRCVDEVDTAKSLYKTPDMLILSTTAVTGVGDFHCYDANGTLRASDLAAGMVYSTNGDRTSAAATGGRLISIEGHLPGTSSIRRMVLLPAGQGSVRMIR
jgi:prepilin-type N-terminal cleavage/methylation domain-containing protein